MPTYPNERSFSNSFFFLYTGGKNLPPQQKPAAPIAEIPLLFKSAITDFASLYPLSYKKAQDI